jgi:hypothetical protein
MSLTMNPRSPLRSELVDAIAVATSAAVTSLFREHHGGHFYYCALVTTGEGLAPHLVAWSTEALDLSVSYCQGDPNARKELKWSYADSPFYCYGDQHFAEVRRLFGALGELDANDSDQWQAGYEFRMAVMEEAMARIDRAGLFGIGPRRAGIVVNVECVPPDQSNVERALRLNPPEALTEWLREAGEVD